MFQNTTLGELNIGDVIKAIKSFLEDKPDADYGLVIGTDSQEKIEITNGKKTASLVTAIVVHRRGFGGRYFWKKKKVFNIHNLREKIYAETIHHHS